MVQEKLESLRTRYLIVCRSSADAVQRLGQMLEASSHLDTVQDDLVLWLSRMEQDPGCDDGTEQGEKVPDVLGAPCQVGWVVTAVPV